MTTLPPKEGPPAVSPAAAPESSHSQSAIVTPTATSMTTTEVEKLEPKEDQAGEALQEPPSASDGDGGELWGEVGEGGGNMIGPQENENSDFQPGPSHAPPPPHLAPSSPHHQEHPRFHMGRSQGDDDTDEDNMGETAGLSDIAGMGGPGQPMPLAHPASMPSGDDDDDDDDEEDGQAPAPEGAYDPADYEHLSVTPEISELFSYITRYTPQAIELEHRLRPYIPDYIPAVGDIDAFIKIPPPDDKVSMVGLEVLDEPSARQSDATVLDLQLRALAKHTTAKSMSVKTVENAEKNGKVIEKWVRDISELHRSKPPPTVHYSKRMPDIDSLMQEWPGELEELFKEVNLPTAALELELPDYVDIICSIMDIPAYKSRVQSLHVLFTLYSVFKNSAHFRQLAEENYIDNEDSTADQLLLQ
ncbi:intraflagellar transport protein 46 homolog isoform X3 [Portunus trituberculatus]|uniref:intraflagellar transport protein 46 homolog isoform X3 n=1 Tax=Portunus trituberculatus TaxID=210409 RepID=UPI001E1D1982|nr:intraflagellar transport protein 46 homolog isoform X3 [Portunus trituberculatus]XP_045115892.1 intraflagellar transport protein 46 homolog isoform X3 [Portunus trituberculatus]XP_045115893.1 intraflagellar transport protein 46 homolog isoform X3 [Portunus trituberculatus]